MKLDAPPMKAMSHIQNTAPGPPSAIAVPTPAMFPTPTREAAEIVNELEAQGLDVLYDDRLKVSPGVKFKDAELIGVPTILVLGKGLADGTVELKDRRSGDRRDVPVEGAVTEVLREVKGGVKGEVARA